MQQSRGALTDRFSVHYRITVNDKRTIEEHANDIAVEQTVELPDECIPDSHHDLGIVGRVEEIVQASGSKSIYDVRISYLADIANCNVPQFLNVLFGNISLKNNIRITDLNLSGSFGSFFNGPNAGIDGVRKLTGIYGRPLACTALKPMGTPSQELAAMAAQFVEGGIDIIKDDHGITDQKFHPFKERVSYCIEAVERAGERTGKKTLYFPAVCGSFDAIDEQVQFAVSQGVRGILIAPMLVGIDAVRYLSEKYKIIIMAHPALSGTFTHDTTHGIAPSVLLGTLFRLIGGDISIFPNWGGRFPFTKEECLGIADALRRPFGSWKGAYPSPAGGMKLHRLKEICDAFGEDTVLLMGGALLQGDGILQTTQKFLTQLKNLFPNCSQRKPEEYISSCSFAGTGQKDIRDVLGFDNYQWHGRSVSAYKSDTSIDFKGVVRSELVGRTGENTKFDLRYFEIEPGGYSSFEMHVHEHVIIGVRGEGVLLKGEVAFPVRLHDIAYVKPMEKHQLRNKGKEPFGFFCIVDHERDRPIKVD